MRRKIILFLIFFLLLTSSIVLAKTVLPFEGHIDFVNKKYVLELNFGDQGSISTSLSKEPNNGFNININIDHLKHSLIELSSELEGKIKVDHQAAGDLALSGKIWSKNSLVNFKPSREFVGSFAVKDQKLIINSLSLGSIVCEGTIGLTSPFNVDLVLKIASIEMKDFLSFFVSEINYEATGFVSGVIKLSGSPNLLHMKGQLASEYGTVGPLDFEKIHFNAEGVYPIIQISDSRVTQADGVIFDFSGNLNLADKENFKNQIISLSKSPIVNLDAEDTEWTYKRMKTSDETGKTELKYMFKKNESAGKTDDEGFEMFGVERSIEF